MSNTADTTLSGIISNGGLSINNTGGGTLTLSGVNTYAGGTTLTAGTLAAGNDSALGTGTLTLNGGTLQASGAARTLANNLTVGGNFAVGGTNDLTLSGTVGLGTGTRIITVNNTGSTTLAGVISGTALLSKAGAGTLTLSGANTYSGGTTVSAGTLQSGGSNSLGTTGTVTINAGGTIDLSGNTQTFATLSGAGNLSNIGSLTVNAGTFSGPISGVGSLTKATAGSLTLSGANTYSGGTTLALGTLIAGSDSAFGTGTVTISGVTTLQASGTRSLSNTVAVGSNFTISGTGTLTMGGAVALGGASRTLTVSSTGSTTFGGVISNGSLTKAGTGSLTLSGANTYTNTTLTTGTLVAGSDSAFGTGTLALNGGTVQASGTRSLGNNITVGSNFAIGGAATDDLILGGTVNLGGTTRTITVNSTGDATLAGVISNGSLSKAGTGTLTLSGGANTYTNTTVSAGILRAAGGNDRLSTTGNTTINAGAAIDLTGNDQTFAQLNGAGNLNNFGTVTIGAGAFSGVISGSGSLTKATAGTLTLSGPNTYTGDTTVSAGILRATGGNDRLSTTGNTTINAGATIDLTGNNQTFAQLNGAGNLNNFGTVTIGAGAFSGVISGSGSLTKNSAGTLTLSGTNTYTGGTTFSDGVVNVASDTNLGDLSGPLTFNGGNLQLSASLSTARAINLLAGGGMIDIGPFNCALNGPLTGDGPFFQLGQASLTLGGDGTGYNGTYTVNSGNLNVASGSGLGGTLIINSGASLSGTGIVTNVTNHGTVRPGNSVGTLSVVGNYTQTASGTLEVEVASPGSYDKINVTGIPGTASLNGTVKPVLLGGYIPSVNQVFPGVITAAGGVTGTFSTMANQFISPILFWETSYTATTFDLLVQQNFANPGLGLTSNQYNVGVMLNGVASSASGDLNTVLNAIASLPSSNQVANAYTQISPDKAAALPNIAFAGANLQKRTLAQRITDLRFGGREMGAVGGLPGSFNLNYSRGEGLMLAYNSASLSGLITGAREAGVSENRWGLYLDPALILGGQRSSVDQTGFNFTIGGFTAGADYRVQENLLVGLATGYSHTGASFHGSGGSVEGNTWPLTAYAAYLPQSFYAYGSLGYALNLFDLERGITFGGLNRKAKGSPTGNQFNGYGEAGYDLKMKRLVVTPAISLAYSKIWIGGFTEDGAGALNLKVPSQEAQSLQTGVGGKIAVPLKRDSTTVVPQAYAFYQHEYSNSSRTLDARLSQAGSSFIFQTDIPHRNFAVVGGNVNLVAKKTLKVQLDYNAEVGRGNYTAHSLSGGVRWEF